MRSFCAGLNCRHRKLAEYFGQTYDKAHCEACDVCLNEVEGLADATLTAQKIFYCVSFFFSSRRRHTSWTGDWSSDVCSSDLRYRTHQAHSGGMSERAAHRS